MSNKAGNFKLHNKSKGFPPKDNTTCPTKSDDTNVIKD